MHRRHTVACTRLTIGLPYDHMLLREHTIQLPAMSKILPFPPSRSNVQTAHIISPGMGGAHFTMYLADLAPNATVGLPGPGIERSVSWP